MKYKLMPLVFIVLVIVISLIAACSNQPSNLADKEWEELQAVHREYIEKTGSSDSVTQESTQLFLRNDIKNYVSGLHEKCNTLGRDKISLLENINALEAQNKSLLEKIEELEKQNDIIEENNLLLEQEKKLLLAELRNLRFPQEPPKQEYSSGWIWFLVIFVVLAGAAGGAWWYFTKKQKKIEEPTKTEGENICPHCGSERTEGESECKNCKTKF